MLYKFFILVLLITNLSSLKLKADLPLIIPHRGGKSELPENTIFAFTELKNLKINIMEIDVQITKDEIPIVYHSKNLNHNTDKNGEIADQNFDIIKNSKIKSLQYLKQELYIPSLEEVLIKFKDIQFIIDLKSLNTKQLIDAIAKILSKTESWDRVIFYSTNIDHYKYLNQRYKHAKKFEARDYTRKRNLSVILNNTCNIQLNDPWIGLELRRDMIIKEKFLLGEGVNKINIKLWNTNVINCTKKLSKDVKIVLFGINNISDYCESIKLGAYAILTDYPKKMLNYKKQLDQKNLYICDKHKDQ